MLLRLARLTRHFLKIRQFPPLQWLWEGVILCLEILGIGEIYVLLNRLFKPNIRRLTTHELAVARSVFGESLPYNQIFIDEKAYIGCKKGRFAYVSFRLINHWGAMTDSHLIHELMHVWQYERLGARYMPRALQAQNTRMGYNYGGLQRLEDHAEQGFRAFNMEQQADIVTDYFLITQNKRAQWSDATYKDLHIYETYIKTLQV
jgi:hypothetical protein